MDDILPRREAGRPRRRRGSAAASELGANASLQDVEVVDVYPTREPQPWADRLSAAAGRMEMRNSAPQMVHHRHMPMGPLKFPIPKKTKENRALFQDISTESREYEDMMTILTSSYLDTTSSGCFTYSKPRLVHSELLEKEFVEKRKEMKTEGRTDKELEESYCFLLADSAKLPQICEKGLLVSQSWITVLGNPSKGVYLSRYSDLLQMNAFTPGATGEIIIFKVMKGKVKSIYENMKNLLDPTPRFDSHVSKNASKITSVNSYRAFELTQQYFYEYEFDELRSRPRQVCPYAVATFQIKGKDSPLPSKPLAPIRMNSQSVDGSKERAQFTVWAGDLVKGDRVLFQISLRSFSPPFLPHRLPEKLEISHLLTLEQVTKLLPSSLFSYDLYSSSQEVVRDGHCCSLLEAVDRNRSTTSVTSLLQELELKRVVVVIPLTERGFLFLLSSVQMAAPTERGESWKRSLQALFVFPETRDIAKSTPQRASSSHDASESQMSGAVAMPRLNQFIPALHHALVKARANPPPELSAGVERQAREYLVGLKDGKVRQYPMGEYDSRLEEGENQFSPKHRANVDGYLRSYLYSPGLYLLSLARAKQVVEAHCGPEQPHHELKPRKSCGSQREETGHEATANARDGQSNTQKMQQLIDLVLTCKRNAENEVKREEGEGPKAAGRKRKMEQETAERALKFLKASQEPGRPNKIQVEGSHIPSSPVSFASVIASVGLRDVDLREDGSELAAKLISLLTGLNLAARGLTNPSLSDMQEERQRESSPFDRLATKLGLPPNCDIDLRKQEELEEQTAGSVSSLEGFSPGSHSGEMNHHGAAGRGGTGRKAGVYEEEGQDGEIPWVLIPITGLCSERYNHSDRNIPQDPRFHHLAMATSISTTTKPPRQSPTLSPDPSPPLSPFQCPSLEASSPPSLSQCPSPDPSPPPSPSQCPSPEPSPPPSPSQCPSPEPSPPQSPFRPPSPQPAPLATSSSLCVFPKTSPPPSFSRCQPLEPNELIPLNKNQSGANEEQLAPESSREFAGVSIYKEQKSQGNPSIYLSNRPSNASAPQRRTNSSPPPADSLLKNEQEKQAAEKGQTKGEVTDSSTEMEQRGKVKEQVGVSLFSPSVSSTAACPRRDIDSIVDQHLGDFSSDVQLLLQEESVHYSFPQSPHSTLNPDAAAPQHTLPYVSVAPFSQYVSFYNPCPAVHDYVSSLQDNINNMLTEFEDTWPRQKPDASRTSADSTLANTVSAFVASVRAANAKTDAEDEVPAPFGGQTAADGQKKTEAWQPDATNCRSSPTSYVSFSVPTSASSSVYQLPNTDVPCSPNTSAQSQWKPQRSHSVTQNTARAGHCTDGAEGQATSRDASLSGFGGVSKTWTDSPHALSPSEPVSSSTSASVPGAVPAPPATALTSLISQLQPEVFNNLVEIIKDIKKNSLQFYLHCTEPGDQVYEDVKDHLLKQGNVEQSPVSFLNQETSDSRLLVIIKNKDIAGHVHKIPGLVSLKRHSSVAFVGIDTLDDIKNNSYNELFVSGGCVVSDELILNPDVISHDRLAALLMFLEQHSSLDSVWRWKIHCKTHKKLKEQSRFRRDAANLLDLLSVYQKRQIVEFLPYHHCDMNNHSPDLDCLIELQARYTQYRHTVFLTEDGCEKFSAYSSGGIIVAGIEDILHNFTRLVGCHDIKDKQPIIDDLLAPKGLSRQLSHGDSVSGSDRSPSIFPEHLPSLSSSSSGSSQPQHLPPQPSSDLPSSLPHTSDQLVPDSFCKDGAPHHSETDFEVLRLAISQLRAERQAQLHNLQQQKQKLESQAELEGFLPHPVCPGSRPTSPPLAQGRPTSPPLAQGRPTSSVQLTQGREAVSATLELIHSVLQPERMEQEEDRDNRPAEGHRRRGRRDGSLLMMTGDASALFSHRTNSTSDQRDTNSDRQGELRFSKAAQQEATSSANTACPAAGHRSSNRY
ncbi:protein TASOR isoform X2 [Mugil cephalus]|uniref:protein TASOR isoform X2 n=1 Tax=Mugil cephalus TaxID=48193 RepID=UPI001FB5DB4F|nr:protein TASOR isoform X2 [Mugil cephalus]